MGGTGRGTRPAVKGRDVTEFSTMGLPEKLLTRIAELGYTDPTPIQARAIPHALNGQDVLGLAQTGTGKTAAFGVPLIAQMMQYGRKPAAKTVRGLVLAPTRELANQIAANLKGLTEGPPIKTGLVVGGVSINPQISRLSRGTDILIATPGRLLDILDRGALDLGSCDFLVLDEADQMLDLGFIHALRKIAALLPEQRQTMLFSATMPKQMNEIANAYLKSPVRIEVTPPGKPAAKVTQSVHFIAKAEKLGLLKELLTAHDGERTLVFGRTKHGMEKLMKVLDKAGFKAAAIHGNKSQGQRERALKAFKSGEITVLVATDVAARGLDVPPNMIQVFKSAKATQAVDALEVIYAEEVAHVAYGSKWFHFLCGRHELDPKEAFHDLVRTYFHGVLKPPFNEEKRAEAGIPPDFYWPLTESV